MPNTTFFCVYNFTCLIYLLLSPPAFLSIAIAIHLSLTNSYIYYFLPQSLCHPFLFLYLPTHLPIPLLFLVRSLVVQMLLLSITHNIFTGSKDCFKLLPTCLPTCSCLVLSLLLSLLLHSALY